MRVVHSVTSGLGLLGRLSVSGCKLHSSLTSFTSKHHGQGDAKKKKREELQLFIAFCDTAHLIPRQSLTPLSSFTSDVHFACRMSLLFRSEEPMRCWVMAYWCCVWQSGPCKRTEGEEGIDASRNGKSKFGYHAINQIGSPKFFSIKFWVYAICLKQQDVISLPSVCCITLKTFICQNAVFLTEPSRGHSEYNILAFYLLLLTRSNIFEQISYNTYMMLVIEC